MENLIITKAEIGSLSMLPLAEKFSELLAEKGRKVEDLTLIKESSRELENRLSNGLLLSKDDEESLEQFILAEKALEKEVREIDKTLENMRQSAKEAIDETRARKTDIYERASRANLGEGNTVDNLDLKQGFHQVKYNLRSREMIILEIETLFERNAETIKKQGLKSIRSLFGLFYPSESYDKKCNTSVRKVIKESMLKFWRGNI